MDRNGLWYEYCEDYAQATIDHGPLTLAEVQEVADEMFE